MRKPAPDLGDLLQRAPPGPGNGPAAHWRNLGLWTRPDQPYAEAAAALADAVANAAGLDAGQRLLSLACGAGAELLHVLGRFDLAAVVGVERDPAAAARARRWLREAGVHRRAGVVTGAALDPALRAGIGGGFDAVLCVDAAYHLSPRTALFDAAAGWLRPGGRLAFTDLVLDAAPRGAMLLRAAAALCGVPHGDLVAAELRLQQLRRAGYVDVQCQRLDEAVLGGFARFVPRQRRVLGRHAWRRAWWPAAVTAALIGPCRAAGLGYALFSARRP